MIVQRDGNRAGNDVESGLLRCVLMFNDASSLMLNYINWLDRLSLILKTGPYASALDAFASGLVWFCMTPLYTFISGWERGSVCFHVCVTCTSVVFHSDHAEWLVDVLLPQGQWHVLNLKLKLHTLMYLLKRNSSPKKYNSVILYYKL